ncbi:TonB-dependent receptor [Chitinophaga sp. SYP-B3965]|uniref:TonB-dependent receptor n=1 Tax=Chitinophaga sp. SYP-B3965 TaxID=2663120 RepID=UPI001564BDAE|nr:TonB-dependent receptor [Chitinophaga sp. SYP-B3965]
MAKKFTRQWRYGMLCLCLSLCLLSKAQYQDLSEKITLGFQSTTATAVIKELAKQAPARNFLFDANLLENRKMENVQYKNVSLGKVLEELKRKYALDFTVNEKYISVKLLPLQTSNKLLKGKVVDAKTSEPLPGVSLLVKGTKNGVVTDETGAFSLKPGQAAGTLLFYFIGYKQQEAAFDSSRMEFAIKLEATSTSLSAVEVQAIRHALQPVQHANERELIQEIKSANSVVSGISSELIAKMADVNAAQVARRIAGVTLTDEQFLVVRGMNQRYNVTYLGDNIAPGTEQYSRAFAMNLLPSRIIDKILVYKSPRADLFGDFAGAAVKVYTKDALAVKHFDIGVRVGYVPGSTLESYNTYTGGKLDWLGVDDGKRALPSNVPGYGDFRKAELSQSDYVKSFSDVMNYGSKTAMPDLQLTANYYNSFKLGSARLYNITGLSYNTETRSNPVYRQVNNTYSSYIDYKQASVTNELQSSEEVTLNLMQNFMLRINDQHSIYFRNFVLQQGRKNTIDRTQRPNAFPDTLGRYSFANALWNRNVVLDYRERFLYAGNLGGNHGLFGNRHQLNWNLGVTHTRNETPDQRISRFVNSDYPTAAFNLGGPQDFDLSWRADDRFGKVPANYDMQGTASRVFTQLKEQVYNASLDYTMPVQSWLEVKAGTYQLFKLRDVARRSFLIYDGELTPGNRYGLIRNIVEGEEYKLPGSLQYVDPALWRFSMQDLGKIWSTDYFREDGSGLRVEDRTSSMDAYRASEQYNAGYVMATAKPFGGKLELNGGLRLEYDQLKLSAVVPSLVLPDKRVGPTILIDRSRLSWLPSFNGSWRPSESWVLRAAYGKTVNRPEFREISPFRDYDYPNNQMINGNPALVQSDISNYDLRLEFYPQKNKGEMMSVGVFYKRLQNPIERIIFSVSTAAAELTAYDNITFTNVNEAIVQGVEVDFRKNLNFIPGKIFRRLSVLFNGSLIRSRVNGGFIATIPGSGTVFIDTATNRPLQGQTPYVVNAGLFYENIESGSKIALNYNVSGTSIYAVGKYNDQVNTIVKYRGSILELPRNLLDLSYTQQFAKRWQMKLSVNNLLNEDIRFAEDQNRDSKYEPEFNTGEKRSLVGRDVPVYGGDNITRRWSPGRNIQANITYSF